MPIASRPYFSVDIINERRYTGQPSNLTVRQSEYLHDVVVLQYNTVESNWTRVGSQYRKGTPIVVTWGWTPKMFETFHGYVHSNRLIRKQGSQVVREVFITGADFSMNGTRLRSFHRMYANQIVKKIAREHRFTSRTDFHPDFFRSLPQLGRSDWALMASLAKNIGFSLSCKRTELQFLRRELSRSTLLPEFRFHQGFGPDQGTLFSFKVKAGSDPLSNTRKLVIGGVDDNGKPFWATDSKEDCCGSGELPNFTSYYTTPASSVEEGRKGLAGWLAGSKFRVQADVVTSGDPRVRCGSTIRFTNVEPGMEGRWWVASVEHKMVKVRGGPPFQYRMHMTVARETIEDTVCITEPPRPSFSGKPVVVDPCKLPPVPEVPTVFAPVDACAPLETPPVPCHCPPMKCPGRRPDRRHVPPRYDGWAASYPQGRR